MEQSDDFTQVIRAFRDQVSIKPWKKFAAPEDKGTSRETTNRFRKQGLESRNGKPGWLNNPPTKPHQQEVFVETSHVEQKLHDMIVANPVLLHTPELYAGGLYLDSILNKQDLGFFRKNDFGYITVQGYTIKITLVEIEQSAKLVFHNKLEDRSKFRSETEKAVGQVKQWQDKLRSISRQKAFLANLKPLFDHYPLALFSDDEEPLPQVKLEFSYVLVVGNERPTHRQHHDLIDDLYVSHNILFMTYPMMIELVEQAPQQKNVLTIGAPGAVVKTLHQPDSLGPDPHNGLGRAIDDPFGIRLAGLGHSYYLTLEHVMNPGHIKQAFYRSEGICEKPGCVNSLLSDVGISATMMPIYNAYGQKSAGLKIMERNNTALCCPFHTRLSFNDGERIALGDFHPLSHAMQKRGAYRADLDIAGTRYMNAWVEGIPDQLIAALEINPIKEPDLAEQIRGCALALRSLPIWSQNLLEKIVRDYYCARYANYIDRSIQALHKNRNFDTLLRAGLIRINTKAEGGKEIEPTILSRALIERIDTLFGERAMFAYSYLFTASASGIAKELFRLRRKIS
jgi:hypothetical protein